jgi:hypothetical protein
MVAEIAIHKGEVEKLKTALALACAILLGSIVACGDDDDTSSVTASPTAAVSAPATLAVTPSATVSPTSTAITSTRFDPQVSVIAPGWRMTSNEANAFEIESDDPSGGIWFLKISQVIDPVSSDVAEAPADLAEWLRSHPKLSVVEEQAVILDGISGTQLEMTTNESERFDLFTQPQGKIMVDAQDSVRFFVMNVDGGQFVILVGTEELSQIEEVYQASDAVLETVHFN